MVNVREVNPNEAFVQIGNKGLMPVVAIGSVLLRFVFQREGYDREHKVDTQVDNVLVVPGMGFNLIRGGESFSEWPCSFPPRRQHTHHEQQADLSAWAYE